jgi:hypothetical protein
MFHKTKSARDLRLQTMNTFFVYVQFNLKNEQVWHNDILKKFDI